MTSLHYYNYNYNSTALPPTACRSIGSFALRSIIHSNQPPLGLLSLKPPPPPNCAVHTTVEIYRISKISHSYSNRRRSPKVLTMAPWPSTQCPLETLAILASHPQGRPPGLPASWDPTWSCHRRWSTSKPHVFISQMRTMVLVYLPTFKVIFR